MAFTRLFTGALVCVLAACEPGFCDASVVGRIKDASGTAFVLRQDNAVPAKAGDLVYESDGLKTEADGRLGITLKDDTRLSLGPDTELRLDRFVFSPAEKRFAFVLKLVRGVVAYVSGRIGRLAPETVRLETPDGVVGIRGTRVVVQAGS